MRNSSRFISTSFAIGILFLLGACGGRPSNVLSESKMVSLMADMEIAEAYANTQTGVSANEKLEYGKRILEAHGVSQETLDTTLAWYGRNMDDYAKLFEKVDKEIIKKQKRFSETPEVKIKEADNLWPYSTHLIMSPLSESDVLTFSLPKPSVKKGDVLEFSFYLPNPASFKGTFGVEYTDGYGEASISNFSSGRKMIMSLQTDTAREISRIYGFMQLKDSKMLPLFIDSIFIKTQPLDTLNYRSNKRTQKHFGALKFQKKLKEDKDTISSAQTLKPDSVSTKSTDMNDSIPSFNGLKKESAAALSTSKNNSENINVKKPQPLR